MQSNIVDELVEARRGDLVVEIRNHVVQNVGLAASLFGLNEDASTYVAIGAIEAESVLRWVIHKDMAYGTVLVPLAVAASLANKFVGEFSLEAPRFFTNGTFGKPQKVVGAGTSWSPATSATFDTGVLVLTNLRTACAWFMDED